MILTKFLTNSIECEILCGSQVGTRHLIPRIEMEPTDTRLPFQFKRIQFPLQICLAMTINKSQGQPLDTVGLYLPRPVFSHGQYYVVVFRVTSPRGLHILIEDDSGNRNNYTANVVYDEVFQSPKSTNMSNEPDPHLGYIIFCKGSDSEASGNFPATFIYVRSYCVRRSQSCAVEVSCCY